MGLERGLMGAQMWTVCLSNLYITSNIHFEDLWDHQMASQVKFEITVLNYDSIHVQIVYKRHFGGLYSYNLQTASMA